MSFGGHVAKAAEAKAKAAVEAEANEEIEAEENEEIERAVGLISLSDEDDRGSDMSVEKQTSDIISIASSANSMELAEARAEVIKLRTENYLAKVALEKANINKVNPKQVMHDDIVKTTADIVGSIKELDGCALWWVNQWVNECLSEFGATSSITDAQKFRLYKDFCMRNKKKKEAGMKHFKNTPFTTPIGKASPDTKAVVDSD